MARLRARSVRRISTAPSSKPSNTPPISAATTLLAALLINAPATRSFCTGAVEGSSCEAAATEAADGAGTAAAALASEPSDTRKRDRASRRQRAAWGRILREYFAGRSGARHFDALNFELGQHIGCIGVAAADHIRQFARLVDRGRRRNNGRGLGAAGSLSAIGRAVRDETLFDLGHPGVVDQRPRFGIRDDEFGHALRADELFAVIGLSAFHAAHHEPSVAFPFVSDAPAMLLKALLPSRLDRVLLRVDSGGRTHAELSVERMQLDDAVAMRGRHQVRWILEGVSVVLIGLPAALHPAARCAARLRSSGSQRFLMAPRSWPKPRLPLKWTCALQRAGA